MWYVVDCFKNVSSNLQPLCHVFCKIVGIVCVEIYVPVRYVDV